MNTILALGDYTEIARPYLNDILQGVDIAIPENYPVRDEA